VPKTTRNTLALLAGAALTFTATPALADGMPDEPLARFEDPVCPGVVGLRVQYAVQVVARIRANVEELGLRTAPDGDCEANLLVTFLDDGRAYLQRLSDRRSWLFESLELSEKRALLSREGPARAWVSTETRTRDGLAVGYRENLVDIPQAGAWSAHSRIYVPTREDITTSMVLIDQGAIVGYSFDQLADYATLYGLADFVPEADSETPSIQRLFAEGPESAPQGLTEFDKAYLHRLYSSIPNLPAYTRLEGLKGMAKRQ